MESIASQFVQYTNDAVEVWYTDGARLQLSACGAAFMYHQPPAAGQHALHAAPSIQQRTQFATSAFKNKVIEAVDFRNRFAERPYLCRQLLDPALVLKLHADIFEIGWQNKLSEDQLTVMPDGSIMMTSLDEYASLTLAPSGQQVTVQYLAKVGQTQARDKGFGTKDKRHSLPSPSASTEGPPPPVTDSQSTQSEGMTLPTSQSESATTDSILGGGRWDYVWTTEHHSVQHCPHYWKQPLDTLISYVKDNDVTLQKLKNSPKPVKANRQLTEPAKPVSKLAMKNCSFSKTPQTLPLNCRAVHLHKWKNEAMGAGGEKGQPSEAAYLHGKLKVVCIHGIVYRLVWSNPRGIEIYPGDGSILRSTGIAGHYFTHYIWTVNKVEERMYSIQCLPPHVPGAKYSVSKLVERGVRFLQLLQEEHTQLLVQEDSCCWKASSSPSRVVAPLPTVLLEECTVEGVGRFSAYSSGHVRVAFTDRVCLDMQADFKRRLEGCRQHSDSALEDDEDHGSCTSKMKQANLPTDVLQKTCRLLLPNGHYQTVLIGNPQGFEKYIQAALEWASWVNTVPSERYHFYKDTIHDPYKRSSVASELQKINCFNYIIEHTVLPQFKTMEFSDTLHSTIPSSAGCLQSSTIPTNLPTLSDPSYNTRASPITMATLSSTEFSVTPSLCATNPSNLDYNMVQEALSKTARHLQSLDKFLETNGESHPVRD